MMLFKWRVFDVENIRKKVLHFQPFYNGCSTLGSDVKLTVFWPIGAHRGNMFLGQLGAIRHLEEMVSSRYIPTYVYRHIDLRTKGARIILCPLEIEKKTSTGHARLKNGQFHYCKKKLTRQLLANTTLEACGLPTGSLLVFFLHIALGNRQNIPEHAPGIWMREEKLFFWSRVWGTTDFFTPKNEGRGATFF